MRIRERCLKISATSVPNRHIRPRLLRDVGVGCLGQASAAAAWASYAQMRLDGLAFLLVVALLFLWGILLALALAAGWGKRKVFMIPATLVTMTLVALLIAVFGDGRATMQQRPLGAWAMFVVLLLAAVPAMLVAPFLQLARHARGVASRLSMAMLVGALALVPVGSILHLMLQESMSNRVFDRARALAPGQLLPHVIASRRAAASSRLNPHFWTEDEELKWILIGLAHGFIERADPISPEDTQALELLVKLSAGTRNEIYSWRPEGRLLWDRLMRAAPGDRPAVAAGLTKQQAQRFNEAFGVPHADWLCTPLADPDTEKAFEHVWTLLEDHDKREFSARVRDQCGRSIGVAAK
jgi:hypothetical protein